MGYTETNSWTLAAADVPALADGDILTLFIQAYPVTGVGDNDIEKARYLHDGEFLGSAWSDPIVVTKHPKAPQNLTFEYDAEKKQVTVSADCPVGATSAKAYKDHVDSGAAYIVDGKITKTFSDIEDGVSHLYGLSALHDGVESAITEKEYTAMIETKILSVDEYLQGTSTWVTGTCQGTLGKKVGLYVNEEDMGSVPMDINTPGQFKYYREGLLATDIVQVYIATEEGKELNRVDVPIQSPKQSLTIFINGAEQTGDFAVKETSQDEYVALSEKSPDVVYAVQPNDPESGLVYFLGDVPVDLVKNTEGVLYNRNLLVGATSEWKDFSISSWTAENHRKEISEYGLSVGNKLIQSIELDNTNSENQGDIRSFITQYDESNTQINTASGETIAVGEAGTSTAAMTIAGNAIKVAISIGHSINGHTDTGKYRKRKIANGTNGDIGSFTIAPEDLLGNSSAALSSKNTIAEIKAFLDEQGIKYKSNANKATLLSLMKG
jgi:hypothetical protein